MFLHILFKRQATFPSTISYTVFSCLLRTFFLFFFFPLQEEESRNVVSVSEEAVGGGKKGEVGREIGSHEAYLQKIPELTN